MAKKQTKPRKLLNWTASYQLLIAVLLFAITVAASRAADMTNWEITVFNHIYGWPSFLRPFFFVITQAGSIYMFAALLLIYIYKKSFHVVTRLLLTGLLSWLISGFAKDLWGRLRPTEVLANVVNLDYTVWGPGFPSGHVALCTALSLTIMFYLPKKLRWTMLLLILLVALSRIYLGIHAPLDVIGGFAIGWASYALFSHVKIESLKFTRSRKNT